MSNAKYKVNGKEVELDLEKKNLIGLLNALSISEKKGIAIAINDSVVPKSQWESVSVHENDHIEIISPFEGG